MWATLPLSVVVQAASDGEPSPEMIWGKEIRAFEAADQTNPPPRGAVLFIGSSSIRLWTNVAQAFPGHTVLNRGFGGSHLSDSVAFVDRIVTPYKPRLIFLYAGDNDIASGKSPNRVLSDFKAFTAKVHSVLPETRIGYIAIKACPARQKYLKSAEAANRFIRDYAASNDRVLFVDVFTPMLSKEGRPRAELCVEDGLHPNAQCYELWASILQPILDKYDPPKSDGKQP
jgi:lysophospholipase L1-like esterase